MKTMKKLLVSLISAALAAQCCAVSGLAAWSVDVDSKTTLYQTNFSDENELSTSWTVETGTEPYEGNTASASIVTDESANNYDLVAPYLIISNPTSNAMARTVKVTKSFTVPSKGIVRASFKYSSDHGAANADIRLTDDGGNGIVIGSGAEGAVAPTIMVDGEEQSPKGSEDNRVFVNTHSYGNWATSYAVGDAYIFDLGANGWGKMWRNIEVVANTSDQKVSTTIAGNNISLGGGVYAVAYTVTTGETSTNILKGYLPAMGDFSKFTVLSKGYTADGKETRIDDVSIDFEPVIYIDESEFANWKGIVWGEIDPALSDEHASMLIKSDASDMSDLGIGWTRFFVGQNYNQDRIESMVRAANENGVHILMNYIKSTGSTEYGTAEEEAAEMEYLTALVNKYKSFTSYWEIGNEQNMAWLDSGRDNEKLENYAKHLRDSYNTITAADPNATVILGGLSEYYAEDWVSEFAKIQVDGHPAYTYCDEVAFHPYAETPVKSNITGKDGSVERVQSFVSAMKTHWDTDMPVWITEVGFHAESSWDINVTPGKVASEDIKAEYLTEVMNKLHSELSTAPRPVMWYILHEVGNGEIAGYGLTKNKISDYGVSTTELASYAAMDSLVTVKRSAVELPVIDVFAEQAGTTPKGWSSNLNEKSETKYVSIPNEEVLGHTAYMRVHKGDGETWDEIQADRKFQIPEGGALIDISFDYLVMCDIKGYGKKILLMDDDTTGIIVEHKYVDDNNIVLTDKDGLGGENYPPTVIGNEERTWGHFNFTINCSNNSIDGLNAGEYILTYNDGSPIKGKMRDGVATLNKIRFTSVIGTNSDTCIDNLNILVKNVPGALEISSASAVDGNAVIDFNSKVATAKGDIIVAAYKDGVFSRVAYIDQGRLLPKGISSVELPLGNTESGESYKVFVWDSVDNVNPVMNSKSF